MNICYNSNFSNTQNKQKCPKYYKQNYGYLHNNQILKNDMQDWNACASSIKTVNCNPLNFQNSLPDNKNMDPVLYNVLNSCWMCNYQKQEFENQYICNRNFYYVDRPPCNPIGMLPKISADEL